MIHDLIPRDVFLKLPPFLSGKSQFIKEEALFCKKIASSRIQVERAIGRMRNYKILNLISCKFRPFCNKIVQVCSALVNLQSPLNSGILDKYVHLIDKK